MSTVLKDYTTLREFALKSLGAEGHAFPIAETIEIALDRLQRPNPPLMERDLDTKTHVRTFWESCKNLEAATSSKQYYGFSRDIRPQLLTAVSREMVTSLGPALSTFGQTTDSLQIDLGIVQQRFDFLEAIAGDIHRAKMNDSIWIPFSAMLNSLREIRDILNDRGRSHAVAIPDRLKNAGESLSHVADALANYCAMALGDHGGKSLQRFTNLAMLLGKYRFCTGQETSSTWLLSQDAPVSTTVSIVSKKSPTSAEWLTLQKHLQEEVARTDKLSSAVEEVYKDVFKRLDFDQQGSLPTTEQFVQSFCKLVRFIAVIEDRAQSLGVLHSLGMGATALFDQDQALRMRNLLQDIDTILGGIAPLQTSIHAHIEKLHIAAKKQVANSSSTLAALGLNKTHTQAQMAGRGAELYGPSNRAKLQKALEKYADIRQQLDVAIGAIGKQLVEDVQQFVSTLENEQSRGYQMLALVSPIPSTLPGAIASSSNAVVIASPITPRLPLSRPRGVITAPPAPANVQLHVTLAHPRPRAAPVAIAPARPSPTTALNQYLHDFEPSPFTISAQSQATAINTSEIVAGLEIEVQEDLRNSFCDPYTMITLASSVLLACRNSKNMNQQWQWPTESYVQIGSWYDSCGSRKSESHNQWTIVGFPDDQRQASSCVVFSISGDSTSTAIEHCFNHHVPPSTASFFPVGILSAFLAEVLGSPKQEHGSRVKVIVTGEGVFANTAENLMYKALKAVKDSLNQEALSTIELEVVLFDPVAFEKKDSDREDLEPTLSTLQTVYSDGDSNKDVPRVTCVNYSEGTWYTALPHLRHCLTHLGWYGPNTPPEVVEVVESVFDRLSSEGRWLYTSKEMIEYIDELLRQANDRLSSNSSPYAKRTEHVKEALKSDPVGRHITQSRHFMINWVLERVEEDTVPIVHPHIYTGGVSAVEATLCVGRKRKVIGPPFFFSPRDVSKVLRALETLCVPAPLGPDPSVKFYLPKQTTTDQSTRRVRAVLRGSELGWMRISSLSLLHPSKSIAHGPTEMTRVRFGADDDYVFPELYPNHEIVTLPEISIAIPRDADIEKLRLYLDDDPIPSGDDAKAEVIETSNGVANSMYPEALLRSAVVKSSLELVSSGHAKLGRKLADVLEIGPDSAFTVTRSVLELLDTLEGNPTPLFRKFLQTTILDRPILEEKHWYNRISDIISELGPRIEPKLTTGCLNVQAESNGKTWMTGAAGAALIHGIRRAVATAYYLVASGKDVDRKYHDLITTAITANIKVARETDAQSLISRPIQDLEQMLTDEFEREASLQEFAEPARDDLKYWKEAVITYIQPFLRLRKAVNQSILVVFAGRKNSGKSTALRTLLRLPPHQSCKVNCGGREWEATENPEVVAFSPSPDTSDAKVCFASLPGWDDKIYGYENAANMQKIFLGAADLTLLYCRESDVPQNPGSQSPMATSNPTLNRVVESTSQGGQIYLVGTNYDSKRGDVNDRDVIAYRAALRSVVKETIPGKDKHSHIEKVFCVEQVDDPKPDLDNVDKLSEAIHTFVSEHVDLVPDWTLHGRTSPNSSREQRTVHYFVPLSEKGYLNALWKMCANENYPHVSFAAEFELFIAEMIRSEVFSPTTRNALLDLPCIKVAGPESQGLSMTAVLGNDKNGYRKRLEKLVQRLK